jgi:hypothetical protein
MLAAPALIDRSMTNYWAGVSGKGNKMRTPLISHWSLPLKGQCHEIFASGFFFHESVYPSPRVSH